LGNIVGAVFSKVIRNYVRTEAQRLKDRLAESEPLQISAI
jgi:hypothetical protein